MAWDLEAITEKWQQAWWDAKLQHAEPEEGKPSYFIHFAYPGISGYLHVGHMRGFTYTDVFARYKRMTGYQVLFPAGFHASGIPAVAFAKEVERGERKEYLLQNGYDEAKHGPIDQLADPQKVVDYFAHVYTYDYWKKFGFLIDERRNCTTVDAGYKRFIQWQFRSLNELGFLIQKPHYAPYCPVAGPIAVDKSETDIRCGGSAEIQEFLALRFQLAAGELAETDEPLILPCATLRPETIYGVTNLWVHPETEYELVRVWQDGAVADDDPTEVWVVSAQGRVKSEWQFERAEALDVKVPGKSLIGKQVTAPVTGKQVPVVQGTFVDPMIASGIVMSVPAHAPFDWAAYVDAGLLDELGHPPKIIDIEGYDDLPARQAHQQFGVQDQDDKQNLEQATEQVYSDEFNKGILTDACGDWAGKRVKAVKDELRETFVQAGEGRILRQFSEEVVSRAGEVVDIRRIPDQDFIHYADEEWTQKAVEHAKSMSIYPQRYGDDMENVLGWFGDRACVRRGAWLGTEFPFKKDWIIEPIADSTFYPWYYIVSPYVQSPEHPDRPLAPEDLKDAFFDYVFNGKGGHTPPKEAGEHAETWKRVRDDVLYWGPVDINLGGKEHQTVHFPVYVMNMVALMDKQQQGPGGPKSMWPKGIFVNWWVTQKAGAKISKSKGGAEPIPGAAKNYGVDPMRLYYCHVGSPHVDIEWDPEIVLSYKQRVERIGRVTDDLLAVGEEAGPMDDWLDSAMAQHLHRGKDAYEAYDLRGAVSELVYAVPDTLRWYQRRGGANGTLLRTKLQAWARALSPLIPHVAEEMWSRCGGQGLCSEAEFPRVQDPDASVLVAESYVRDVLEDIQTVRKLADVEQPQRLTLYTTPAWKRQLASQAVQLADGARGKFPVGAFMKQVMADPDMRERGKEVQKFTGKLPGELNQMSDAHKAFLAAQVDEAKVLQGAVPFLSGEVGVAEVRVVAADDDGAAEHPKRSAAAPLKPGIALE